jgi:hypothetical protein
VAFVGGPLAGSGTDEDQSQMILKLVRKFFQRVRSLSSKSGDAEKRMVDAYNNT